MHIADVLKLLLHISRYYIRVSTNLIILIIENGNEINDKAMLFGMVMIFKQMKLIVFMS